MLVDYSSLGPKGLIYKIDTFHVLKHTPTEVLNYLESLATEEVITWDAMAFCRSVSHLATLCSLAGKVTYEDLQQAQTELDEMPYCEKIKVAKWFIPYKVTCLKLCAQSLAPLFDVGMQKASIKIYDLSPLEVQQLEYYFQQKDSRLNLDIYLSYPDRMNYKKGTSTYNPSLSLRAPKHFYTLNYLLRKLNLPLRPNPLESFGLLQDKDYSNELMMKALFDWAKKQDPKPYDLQPIYEHFKNQAGFTALSPHFESLPLIAGINSLGIYASPSDLELTKKEVQQEKEELETLFKQKGITDIYNNAQIERHCLVDMSQSGLSLVRKVKQLRALRNFQSQVVKLGGDTLFPEYTGKASYTFRISSFLHNLPKSIGRSFICAPESHKLAIGDFDQFQMRIMANLSGDTGLKDPFFNNEDPHSTTALNLFGNKSHRAKAKAVNFGIAYGETAYTLCQQLGLKDVEEAERHLEVYWETYSQLRSYRDRIQADIRVLGGGSNLKASTNKIVTSDGLVHSVILEQTLIKYLAEAAKDPKWDSINKKLWSAAYRLQESMFRKAFTFHMQAHEATIMKELLVRLTNIQGLVDVSGIEFLPSMIIHDELHFYCQSDRLPNAIPFLPTPAGHVPYKIGFKNVSSWSEK